jgi:hypothetical protein
MIAVPESGFVFLSTTKTGSTAIENVFAPHAQIVARRPPSLKHITARSFYASFAPILSNYGYPPESYELICVIREPIDWVASWWRYRSRPEAAGRAAYTGDLSFDEFADRIIAGEVHLGNMRKFVSGQDGGVAVTTMFRYDRIDGAVAWMAERIGIPKPRLRPANVSPDRQTIVSPVTRSRLEEHYATHLALYEAAL